MGEGEPAWVGKLYPGEHVSAPGDTRALVAGLLPADLNNYGLKQMLPSMPFILASGGMLALGNSHCD